MKTLPFILLVVAPLTTTFAQQPQSPDEIYGQLFRDVQLKKVFPDEKTFVDCVPKRDAAEIMADYSKLSKDAKFDLNAFVANNFTAPANVEDIVTHIRRLWCELRRDPAPPVEGSSLLPLPNPYIVPGGRFREVYYWDSYFTMLGLKESGEVDLIEDIVKNFASLIDRYGFIPNGNRTYYLSRSQPPYFSMMVEVLAGLKGDSIYVDNLSALEKEYAYWTDQTAPTKHVVQLANDTSFDRYYDQLDIPRQESYSQDVATSETSKEDQKTLYRNIRSAAESGWDFSSRWFADGHLLGTIQTTNLIPVDLNCLLYHLEVVLGKAHRARNDADKNDTAQASDFEAKAEKRKNAINQYCWSPDQNWYVDVDLQGQPSKEITLAGVAPLFFKVAPSDRVDAIVKTLKDKFVQPGGVVTTLKETGQQWDSPNGWAPLQWLTIQGLRNYGQDDLAKDLAERWMKLNVKVYKATGKLMEKYDVMDLSKPSGGGEYPSQDGFGWTNGVFLELVSLYGMPAD